jgi:hypothetical protein
MANDAASTPLGMDIDMESYRTLSQERVVVPIPPTTPSGLAGIAIEACATKGRNGLLSDAERLVLGRIHKDRRLGFMPSFVDFDFLLEICERLSR